MLIQKQCNTSKKRQWTHHGPDHQVVIGPNVFNNNSPSVEAQGDDEQRQGREDYQCHRCRDSALSYIHLCQ